MALQNAIGRMWGILLGIWRNTKWVKDFWAKLMNYLPGMWLWGPVVVSAWLTMWWNAIDAGLAAQVTLNSVWDGTMNGAPGLGSVGDILSYANYYFPLDVLGQLTGIYTSVWMAVATVKSANKMVATFNSFKSAVFK